MFMVLLVASTAPPLTSPHRPSLAFSSLELSLLFNGRQLTILRQTHNDAGICLKLSGGDSVQGWLPIFTHCSYSASNSHIISLSRSSNCKFRYVFPLPFYDTKNIQKNEVLDRSRNRIPDSETGGSRFESCKGCELYQAYSL